MQNTKPKSNLKIILLLMAAVLILSAGLIALPSSGAQPVKAAGEQLTDQSYGPLNFYEYCDISVPGLTQSNFVSFTITSGMCSIFDITANSVKSTNETVKSDRTTTSISSGVITVSSKTFSSFAQPMSYGSPLGALGYKQVSYIGLTGVIKYYKAEEVITEYTVLFNLNGGTLSSGKTNQQIKEGGYAVAPVTTLTGKDFSGWTVNGSTTTYDPASYRIYANTTFTAKWSEGAPVLYNLTFKFNGGDYHGYTELVIPVWSGEVYYLPIEAVVFPGYELTGYKSSSGTVYTETVVVYGHMTLTAQWKYVGFYTATFDLNGGIRTGGGELSQQITPGSYPVEPEVEKPGYIFANWTVDGNGAYPDIHTLTKNTTFKAEWIKIEEVTVTFNLGSHCTYAGGGELIQTRSSGSKPVYPLMTPNDDKMQFKGWSAVPNGSTYIDVQNYRVYGDVTLHAIWYMPGLFKVEFVFSDGTAASLLPFVQSGILTQNVYENEYAAAPVLKSVEGLAFAGWFVGSSNTPVDISTYKIASDTVFRAKFSSTGYKVTFNLNGGTRTGGGNLEQTLIFPSKPVLPVVSLTGYSFLGWKYVVNGSERLITDVSDFSLSAPADVELTAAWGSAVTVLNNKTQESITILSETAGGKYILRLPLFTETALDKKTSAQFMDFTWGKWALGLAEKNTAVTFDIKAGKLNDFLLYMYRQEAQHITSYFDFQSLDNFVIRSLNLDSKAVARVTVYVDEDGAFIFQSFELVLSRPEITVNYETLEDVLAEEPASSYDWWLPVVLTVAAAFFLLAAFVFLIKGGSKVSFFCFAIALVIAVITALVFFV